MTIGYALNIERRYGPGIVRVAAKHLLRELAAELGADSHIDAARIADNFILRGPDTSTDVAAPAKSLMAAAGVTKCRKGAVTCLELLFTLPPTVNVDPRQYFEQAISWAERYFGVPVLSCVGHADEGPVHAHALLLPLVDGHMVGSDLHGGKAKLAAMQTSFHEAVGAPHGLPKYVPQKRLSAPVRAAAMALARETLQANAALNDDIVDALLAPHAKDPAPLLLALGIAMSAPARKAKGSFVDLMTRPVPLEQQSRIGKQNHKPVGKVIQVEQASSLPDTCVGEGNRLSANPAHGQPLQPSVDATVNTPAVIQRQQAAAELDPAPTIDHEGIIAASLPAGAQWSGAQRSTTGDDQGQQSSSAIPAPSAHVQTVSSEQPRAVQQLDTAATGTGQLVVGPAEAPRGTNPTNFVRLVDVSSSARISHSRTTSAGGHASNLGAISGGARNFADTPTDDDTLETQQVDQQAGQASLRSPNGGAIPAPRPAPSNAPSMPIASSLGEYHRDRDDDRPAEQWNPDTGEFVAGPDPPPSASRLYP